MVRIFMLMVRILLVRLMTELLTGRMSVNVYGEINRILNYSHSTLSLFFVIFAALKQITATDNTLFNNLKTTFMANKKIRHFVWLFLTLLGMATSATATSFKVQLTNTDVFDSNTNNFGVKVAADGTYTATAVDDASATFTVKAARWNDKDHGWVNCVFTIPVDGPVKVGLGNCQFGAQDGTIVDAAGNSTALTVGNANCWHNNKDANISYTVYKGTAATTLTVTYNGYCPFISVESVDPSQLASDATVTFASGEATGAVPAAVKQEVGSKLTLPKNFTLYVEGKTLTAWTDGTKDYAPGTEYTVPDKDVTLTAKFSANEVSLSDRTEPVTLTWTLRRDQGAPTVAYQNATGIWVTQATVNGKTIDVKADFDTNNGGKFANGNWNDWAQLNSGTKWTIPSCKGATVSMEAYSAPTTTTIDGQTDYTASGTTISYEVANKAETIDIVIGDGSYYRYIRTVLPVVQSQGGKTYTNEAATVTWPMSDPANYSTATATPDGVFSAKGVELGAVRLMDQNGNENATGTSTVSPGIIFPQMRPTNDGSDYVTWTLKPAAGLTFTPKKISAYIVRFGTDAQSGVNISAKVGDGEAMKLGTYTAPRNNKTQADDKFGSSTDYAVNGLVEITLTEAQQQALTSGETLSVMGTIGVGNGKAGGIAQVSIEGVVNGTAAAVAKYTLTATASPAEGGSVKIYPQSDDYEAGSEVTLTATENFGYDFVNWTDATGAELSTEPKFKYTVNANSVLTANFKKVNTYALNVTVDGTNDYMVAVSPQPDVVDGKWMYEEGATVVLTANQYTDLVTFTNWSDNTTNSEMTVKMTQDVSVTAYYTEADIIAGWDFYLKGSNGRKADFAAQDNDADVLMLTNTETGETSGWLDKSAEAAGGYESFKGAAVNWRTGAKEGDVGYWHWQTKVNAGAFENINVQFDMMYNYNAYQTYDVEYSLNGSEWTKVGSITMEGAKNAASYSGKLPAACNNQQELYIRMKADKTSKVDGSSSANDGNTLAMFFITGTPKLIDDGKAPVLVSSVPAKDATGASGNGKVVLTFDERVKVKADTKATLGTAELTPVVSGKVITFEYKGLQYGTAYTFTLPANTVSDLTDNYISEAITFNFTTMTRPTVSKADFDAVVENVEQLSAAIKAANTRADKAARYRIFLKKGTYKLPTGATKHYKHTNNDGSVTYWEGDLPDPITYVTAANISFIGEDRDATIITQDITNDDDMLFQGQFGKVHKYEEIGNSGVLQLEGSATGIYFQDVTIKSGINDALGRNLAVHDKSSKTIYKNTLLYGYQDTWTSNNNGIFYFEGGAVRGRTDYMCGKGDAYFNKVELRQMAGGYAAVPSTPKAIGWVYKDCVINGEGSGVDGNYTLGRPWGKGTPVAVFIDTKMNVVPSGDGWNEMSGGWPKRFAEYNSMTATGSTVDLTGRKTVFGDNHANNPVLTAAEAAEYSDMSKMFGDWVPTLLTEQAPQVTNVELSGSTLTWKGNDYALNYAVCKNGSVVAFTTAESFDVSTVGTTDTDVWSIRAANEMGGLNQAVKVGEDPTTAIESVKKDSTADDGAIYTLQGVRVAKATKGIYIINGKKVIVR